jgi:hypothetical protein
MVDPEAWRSSVCPQRKHSNVLFLKADTAIMLIPHFGQIGR